ncbi:MAG: hypothetical protein ABIG37_00560 [Nanoarchaeota archaeon]|nr:hypothetical protein [Nanoarchaeota archaeon]
MIYWNPEISAVDFGNYVVKRLGLEKEARRINGDLVDVDYRGINFEIRFVNGDNCKDRFLRIDILPFKKELDGLEDFIADDVETKKIFSKGKNLQTIGNKRVFGKYAGRLEYFEMHKYQGVINGEPKDIISVTYKIREPLLKLKSKSSIRKTIFEYALAPFLDWAMRKK